jgi:hypothetical protein
VTDPLRVVLEIGKKRRVVAGALDWPGLDRWGTSEEDALAKLSSYRPRYAGVAKRAGMAKAFVGARDVEVIESRPRLELDRLLGHRARPSADRAGGALPRRPGATPRGSPGLLAEFDAIAARVSRELRPAPAARVARASRSSGTSTGNEPEQMSRKVEVRTPLDVVPDPGRSRGPSRGPTSTRSARTTRTAKPARTWPIQFLIRRTGHHAMDHAWELEDRDLNA